MASDEELMLSAAGGDMEAFGELVLRHQDRAWRTAYHYVGNRADAEELAVVFRKASAEIDKAGRKRLIHPNAAARKKSRLAKRLAKASQG